MIFAFFLLYSPWPRGSGCPSPFEHLKDGFATGTEWREQTPPFCLMRGGSPAARGRDNVVHLHPATILRSSWRLSGTGWVELRTATTPVFLASLSSTRCYCWIVYNTMFCNGDKYIISIIYSALTKPEPPICGKLLNIRYTLGAIILNWQRMWQQNK
jgi:hypothetical protein